MNKPEVQDRINKAKVKNHLKAWAMKVRMNNMAYRIPDELFNSLDPKLDKYVNTVLTDLGLVFINGLWERK